jgi:hypothetical protein
MKIDLPDGLAQQVLQNSALQGVSPDQLVADIVSNNLALISRPQKLSADERKKLLHEIIKLHPQVDHIVDDSRESIYEGRGE